MIGAREQLWPSNGYTYTQKLAPSQNCPIKRAVDLFIRAMAMQIRLFMPLEKPCAFSARR